ncbi:hypothetical protein OIU79_007533 [Salix purpurea]|uniref:Uncharacterized protein n=1 Tax=Salix purpurea TaxID=77065 RepID=A0A9Q0TY30_SALPP|nr:hypothetical protein OIU79_007533 [Salix purpurea]
MYGEKRSLEKLHIKAKIIFIYRWSPLLSPCPTRNSTTSKPCTHD